MSKSIRLIWSLIRNGKLLIEVKGNGVEVPVLKDDVNSCQILRKATSHDIKYVFESDAWKNMVVSGRVFYV